MDDRRRASRSARQPSRQGRASNVRADSAIRCRVHGVVIRLTALDDIVASKEFANRTKDDQALPELRELQLTVRRQLGESSAQRAHSSRPATDGQIVTNGDSR